MMTWMDAIVRVLRDAGEPMDYGQVAQAIIDAGYRDSAGTVSPAMSVNATVSQYIRNQGDRCEVVRVKRGQLGLREWAVADLRLGVSGTRVSRDREPARNPRTEIDDAAVEEDDAGLISAYGMYWRRDYVQWNNSPKLLGAQQLGAKVVDFSRQIGIYVLYDGSRPIYVGQVFAPRLGVRLYEHTRDRLNGRWQRFSWFGLRPVGSGGVLADFEEPASLLSPLVDTLEAILIEVVEPVQNRRMGNGFSAVEYIQAEDPEIAQAQQRALAMRILDSQLS